MSHRVETDEMTGWKVHVNEGEVLTREQVIENEKKETMGFVEAWSIVTSRLRDDGAFQRNFFYSLGNIILEELGLHELEATSEMMQMIATKSANSFINHLTQTEETKEDELQASGNDSQR